VVVVGTPEDVAACSASYTGGFLAKVLDGGVTPVPGQKKRRSRGTEV
jgi:hypothetical protein